MLYGLAWGTVRHHSANMDGKQDQTLGKAKGETIHQDGVLGEMAVYWFLYGDWLDPTCGTYKTQADIGDNIEVRCRIWRDGDLGMIYRPNDNPDAKYVHVVRYMNHFKIWGWMWGADCAAYPLVDLGNHGRPAHLVDPDDLRPMESLGGVG